MCCIASLTFYRDKGAASSADETAKSPREWTRHQQLGTCPAYFVLVSTRQAYTKGSV